MIEPCELPIGLYKTIKDYHHLHYKGIDVRTTWSTYLPENPYKQISLEVWTEPNIFHGHVILDFHSKEIIGVIQEEQHGIFSLPKLAEDLKNPMVVEIFFKIMNLYERLFRKDKLYKDDYPIHDR